MISIQDKAQRVDQTAKEIYNLIVNKMLFDNTYIASFSPSELNTLANKHLGTVFEGDVKKSVQVYGLSQGHKLDLEYIKDNNSEGQKDGSRWNVTLSNVSQNQIYRSKLDYEMILGNQTVIPTEFDQGGFAKYIASTFVELCSRSKDGVLRYSINDMNQAFNRFDYNLGCGAFEAFDENLQEQVISIASSKHKEVISITSVESRGWLVQKN